MDTQLKTVDRAKYMDFVHQLINAHEQDHHTATMSVLQTSIDNKLMAQAIYTKYTITYQIREGEK